MNPGKTIDILGIGNAIVDVIASSTDETIQALGLEKGAMRLITASEAEIIYEAMGPATEVSGGSVCNTLAVISALGGSAALIAKISEDILGSFFAHDIHAAGVDFSLPETPVEHGTGRCLIQVTPDSERTMATYLGASVELGVDEVEARQEMFAKARLVLFDGYLLDQAHTRTAIAAAINLARSAGTPLATSLGDARCVARNHAAFEDLIQEVSLLFANEKEILTLVHTETDVEGALSKIARDGLTVVVTRGADGCTVLQDGVIRSFPSVRPVQLVDTTGAGDSFAAGFTFGWIRGWEAERSAHLGAAVAARIIAQTGARPQTPLRDIVEQVSGALHIA